TDLVLPFCKSVKATCPSLMRSSFSEICPEEPEEDPACELLDSDAKFHTPWRLLINSTLGCWRLTESISSDLLSRGISLTETSSSCACTNGAFEGMLGSSAIARLSRRNLGGNKPRCI